ncbi:MAG: hypothetical protein ACREP7_14995 [Lysobacter sp.]
MNVTDRERVAPTRKELEELLGMLIAANDEGQLVSLVFVLQAPRSERTMVDYRGSHEITELGCRTVRERIATAIELQHPAIADKIREDQASSEEQIH